jgi:hypothetical protein
VQKIADRNEAIPNAMVAMTQALAQVHAAAVRHSYEQFVCRCDVTNIIALYEK